MCGPVEKVGRPSCGQTHLKETNIPADVVTTSLSALQLLQLTSDLWKDILHHFNYLSNSVRNKVIQLNMLFRAYVSPNVLHLLLCVVVVVVLWCVLVCVDC